MLYKQRTKPKQLEGLYSLVRRLPVSHEKYPLVYEELYKQRAGFSGEQEYDRYMKEVHTSFPHAILHDLTLKHNDVLFQMDSVFIAPDRIIITEIKNIAERIVVKDSPIQFIKETATGERKVFRSPFAELERKIHFTKSWLSARGIDIPVEGLLTFAYHNEISLEVTPHIPIISNYEGPTFFRDLVIGEPQLTSQEINLIANEFLDSHFVYNPFPLLARYGIHVDDLLKGFFCQKCSSDVALVQIEKKWKCLKCGEEGRAPYEQTIKDYFMIVGNTLTNREFCAFTGLTCRHTAKRMLTNPLLLKTGTRKATRYTLAN